MRSTALRVKIWQAQCPSLAVCFSVVGAQHAAPLALSQQDSYCFGALGSGGGRRSISVGTAIDRAPFFPTDRTAKK
jgi:hypothetical protein